jgi:hypothetical protein
MSASAASISALPTVKGATKGERQLSGNFLDNQEKKVFSEPSQYKYYSDPV